MGVFPKPLVFGSSEDRIGNRPGGHPKRARGHLFDNCETMAGFHYHAVKQAEDDLCVTYAVTHDYIGHPDASVLFTLSKANGQVLSEALTTAPTANPQPPSEHHRSRLAGWLTYKVNQSLSTQGAVEDAYWHTG